MSHFSDIMDGVPVKISERYKRPPRIELPYSVNECMSKAQNVVENLDYCLTFEKNVLTKIKEYKNAKEKKKNERRHRLQLLEEAKQKKLDAIAAAEAEEKLKQLSVSEVSYPSTEEISSITPENNINHPPDIGSMPDSDIIQSITPTNFEVTNSEYVNSSLQKPDLNILQPVQVQSNYNQNSLLDDPDPLQDLRINVKMSKISQFKQNVETLTYKDFENDTSSPFDNVELKTINDMELLAQVLQSQKNTGNCSQQVFAQDQPYPNIPSTPAGPSYLPSTYIEQPIQGGQSTMYASPQHYPMTNGYYIPENICDNTMPIDQMNMYMPNYQYYVPLNPYDPNYYNNQMVPGEINQMQNNTFIPSCYYPYTQVPSQYSQYNNTMVLPENKPNNVQPNNTAEVQNVTAPTHSIAKSRSRSVPDIVKELNEELAFAKLRAKERSYNASPAPKTSEKKKEKKKVKHAENLPNPFEKLPPPLQSLCKKIHGMGFPLDRVARVCSLVGDSDKKIIEGLLLMGELMDLGFPEGKVSAALAKHEFNRDKALDELVS